MRETRGRRPFFVVITSLLRSQVETTTRGKVKHYLLTDNLLNGIRLQERSSEMIMIESFE
jgi:hypothetical protein